MVKKIKEELEEKVEDVEEVEEESVSKSEAKKAFRAIIEAYKVRNPVKYEMKREALKAQLDAIK